MGNQEKKEKKVAERHEKRVERARENYNRKIELYDERQRKREEFLERNDSRMEKVRNNYDENLEKRRKKVDSQISSRRKKIRENYVKGDSYKEEKLKNSIKKTDDFIENARSNQDKRIKQHRETIKKRREAHDEYVDELFDKARRREEERLRRIEEDKYDKMVIKRFKILLYSGAGLFVSIIAIEFLLPGTTLKKYDIIDDTPISETLGLQTEEYETIEQTEEQILWALLNDHFGGKREAVLGVMCNLNAESRFTAGNLEDYNNNLWGVDDTTYTEKINRKTINQKDFSESRYINATNGYYNKYNQWVNKDGGYGYAQFTSYEKKDELYEFAKEWFSDDGPGADYKFNIADPKMQAHFIVHLLESDEYKNMDTQIRNAGTVVDACYIWLKMYEIPYDPYDDGYYTLAFDRAAAADGIEQRCTQESTEEDFNYDY